jgi:hypothetical protein
VSYLVAGYGIPDAHGVVASHSGELLACITITHSGIPVRSATRNRHGKKAQDSHISSNAHAAKVSRAMIRRNTKPGQESASIIIHPHEAREDLPLRNLHRQPIHHYRTTPASTYWKHR